MVPPENAQLALLFGETRPFKSVALTLGRFNAQVKSFYPKKSDPDLGPTGAPQNPWNYTIYVSAGPRRMIRSTSASVSAGHFGFLGDSE